MAERKKQMGLPKKLGIGGMLVCVFGVAFGWGILPSFVKSQIRKSKGLSPGSDGRKMWEKLPFPMIFKMHVFNVTNHGAVSEGEIPMLHEIGPYYFDEWKEKVDIEDDEANDTVTFYMKNTWIFNKNMSWPLTGEELVYIPHPALLGIVLTAEREKPAFLALVAKALAGIFNNPSDVFLKTTVMDLLFNGNILNCTGQDFPVKSVCGLLKKKGSFPEIQPNILQFSVFGQRNGTKEEGQFRVFRGIKDAQKVGQMVTFNGLPHQTVWAGAPCNKLDGTDSTIFPPFVSKQDLLSFSPDLCRSMAATFEKSSLYKTIPALQYSSNFGDMSKNPEEKCFCPAPDKCLKKGVMDLFSCQGVPLIASLPHFYNAHEDYQHGVRGLQPEESKHGITIKFEALTGTPLLAKKRLQFSLPIHNINKINMTIKLPDVILPFLWVEEGIELSDVILAELDSKLFSVLRAIDVSKWVFTGAGTGISLLGAGLNYLNPFSSKIVTPG